MKFLFFGAVLVISCGVTFFLSKAALACILRGWHQARRHPTGVYFCQEKGCAWRGTSLADAGLLKVDDVEYRKWEGQ